MRAIRHSRPLAHPQTQLQAVDDVRKSRESRFNSCKQLNKKSRVLTVIFNVKMRPQKLIHTRLPLLYIIQP